MEIYTDIYDIFNDNYAEIHFFMSANEFIFVTPENKIIKKLSMLNLKNGEKILNEYKKCENEIIINNRMNFLYWENKNGGIAHALCKLTTYLRFIKKYRGKVLIPIITHTNIINIIKNIFDDIIVILEPNKKYIIKNYFFSKYFDFMENIAYKICVPDNKHPLIVYNNDVYWFRSFVNNYIDYKMEKKETYKKIFVGKFEGQGSSNNKINKPRTILGCASKELLLRFEKNGFINIDPYTFNIHDILYYIRNAEEVIFSCGSCVHFYCPFVTKKTKVYVLMNVIYDTGIYKDVDNEHSISSEYIIRFFNDFKICFYNYAPSYDDRVTEKNVYKGEDMFDFLTE